MHVFYDMEKHPFFAPNRPSAMFNIRSIQTAVVLGCVLFLTLSLYPLHHARNHGSSVVQHYKDAFTKLPAFKAKQPKEARRLYAKELMERPLATDFTQIPKIFHQSWMNNTLPAKFEEWSHSCRKQHPDWEWVLWTDEDNLKLVERFAPWFMNAYEDLRGEIYRADAARNIYMHVFGGVYADLDTECLQPYDTMFANYNISTVSHIEASTKGTESVEEELSPSHTTSSSKKTVTSTKKGLRENHSLNKKPDYAMNKRKLFLGRMGTDNNFGGSIPNAWMASTPGHPFWLLPLESCVSRIGQGWSPEDLTGPTALLSSVNDFENNYGHGNGPKLDDHYAKSGWRHLFKHSSSKTSSLPPQSIEILPFWEIYPYSWERDGQMYRDVCWVAEPTFNARKCKLVLGLDHWKTHSITYWSHSWTQTGHDEGHLEAIGAPNTKKPDQEGQKLGDATSENKKLEQEKERLEHEKQHELDDRSIESPSRARRRRRSAEAEAVALKTGRSVKAPGGHSKSPVRS